MNHTDHVNLLRGGVTRGTWADFGSGAGAFTLALAELLGSDGQIYSIDRDRHTLDQQRAAMQAQFPEIAVTYINGDFTRKLELPPLDGAVMANSLHFVQQQDAALQRIRGYLKQDGRLIIVEYNVDRGNTWVPHPFSFETWHTMAKRNGFTETRLLSKRPSSFLGEIYSAVSIKPGESA